MAESIHEPETRTIRLRDGRRLAYVERGDAAGSPVLHCHGVPGSRLEHVAQSPVYRGLGARVITPDRPGYGLSDALPGRTVADWVSDVAQLADQLGIDRFSMTGLSGGGVFALACAALLPDRITRVAATGCPAPKAVQGLANPLPARLRIGLHLAGRAPWLFSVASNAIASAVRSWPDYFVAHTNHDNVADRAWLALPAVHADATDTVREAFRAGGRGYAEDVSALARSWGFALGQIQVPVLLWHGDADTVIPLSHGRYLASVIPNATLNVCRGEGHMLLWNHLREVLLTATDYGGVRSLAPVA